MALTLVTPPATEPITSTEAKLHLRVDINTDDSLITSLITAARQHVEVITRRALITQTWDLTLDTWPDSDTILMPLPPLQSVTSITYKDTDGNESTFSSEDYIVDTAEEPGRIVLAYGKTWPSTTLYPAGAITVRFTAGYGDEAANVPEAIKQAMLLLIGHWYENREATTGGIVVREVPFAVEALLWPYRILRWL